MGHLLVKTHIDVGHWLPLGGGVIAGALGGFGVPSFVGFEDAWRCPCAGVGCAWHWLCMYGW